MNFDIKNNKYNFEINDLLELGKRTNNPRRNFLFISKLLGKHIIVKPDMVKAAGVLLAALKYDCIDPTNIIRYIKGEDVDIASDLNQKSDNTNKVLVIGFAETATGLGMAVASAINGCTYQTTTREPIKGMKNLLSFEEEHSHATNHQCFSLIDEDFTGYDEIILVDDEITTGKTMVNLITELQKITNIKKYNIFTILDWRVEEYLKMYEDYSAENDVELNVFSIMSGFVSTSDTTVYTDDKEVEMLEEHTKYVLNVEELERVKLDTTYGRTSYFKNSGRFGVSEKNITALEDEAKKLATRIGIAKEGEKVLVLGHGENIYIPSRVASYMKADYRTTTRSPIYCDGKIIKSKHGFIDRDVTYFLYNKDEIEKEYDRIVLLTETDLDIKMFENIEIYKI